MTIQTCGCVCLLAELEGKAPDELARQMPFKCVSPVTKQSRHHSVMSDGVVEFEVKIDVVPARARTVKSYRDL
jgi:hypothetical protein